jgi:hypothetical protein
MIGTLRNDDLERKERVMDKLKVGISLEGQENHEKHQNS